MPTRTITRKAFDALPVWPSPAPFADIAPLYRGSVYSQEVVIWMNNGSWHWESVRFRKGKAILHGTPSENTLAVAFDGATLRKEREG